MIEGLIFHLMNFRSRYEKIRNIHLGQTVTLTSHSQTDSIIHESFSYDFSPYLYPSLAPFFLN